MSEEKLETKEVHFGDYKAIWIIPPEDKDGVHYSGESYTIQSDGKTTHYERNPDRSLWIVKFYQKSGDSYNFLFQLERCSYRSDSKRFVVFPIFWKGEQLFLFHSDYGVISVYRTNGEKVKDIDINYFIEEVRLVEDGKYILLETWEWQPFSAKYLANVEDFMEKGEIGRYFWFTEYWDGEENLEFTNERLLYLKG